MKTSIKSLTITIEELRSMLAEAAASGNTAAGEKMIDTKIREKSVRLARQREARRNRRRQQQSISNPEKTDGTPCSEKHNLKLTKDLAKSILWFSNRRDALKANISLFVSEISRAFGLHPSSFAAIELSMELLLHVASQAAPAAHDFLHAKYHLRPASAPITL